MVNGISSKENGRTVAPLAGFEEVRMLNRGTNGLVNVPSDTSVDRTVERVVRILQTKGVQLFALIDHSGEAQKAGLKMRPTKLLIFGNPKAGTPLMLAVPSIAIDLPLKILVSEDGEGQVWITYNSAEYLQTRHQLPAELAPPLRAAETVAAAGAE
jgi:uncharacterized protein (DUF302 family)